MAAIDSIGLINVIDECFDKYQNNRYTPYNIEENSSILSFLKKAYSLIKTGEIFDNENLLETYKECIDKILKKLNQIEDRKIYEYSFRVGTSETKTDYIINLFRDLWKYVDRNFPKNLTENERKIGYYETVNGRTFFNGYRENIIISGELIPSYENDKVVYKIENNKYCIKMNGITEERPNIQLFIEGKDTKFYSLESFIDKFKNLEYGDEDKFYSRYDETNLKVHFAFSEGFIVNDMNEYENPNGIIYEVFLSLLKTLNDKENNYFKEYLKRYFYSGIVARYREKNIDDKETNLISTDLNFGKFDNVFTGTYETLSGKGGNIGGIQTIDFDKKEELGKSEYIRLMFDKSYYDPADNKIKIYINKNYLNGLLKSIEKYNNIFEGDGSYLEKMKSKYSSLRYYDGFNIDNIAYLNNTTEIKRILLKETLFAVEPYFWPENNISDKYWDRDFYIKNIKNIQKIYFYNNNSSLIEDELLKELSSIEGDEKQYTKSQKDINISFSFDNSYLIISLQNNVSFDANDIKFLGGGYINLKKVPQKFKDNKVSRLIDNEYTNKNSYFESEEFSSALDDREITIIHSSPDVYLHDTEKGFLPAFTGKYLDSIKINNKVRFEIKNANYYKIAEFPAFKKGKLYDTGNEIELECTEFAKKVDLGSLKQIRVMSISSNKDRFLFNVKRIKKQYTSYESSSVEFENLENLNDINLTYPVNNKLNVANDSVQAYSVKGKYLNIKNTDSENFKSSEKNIEVNWNVDLSDKNYFIDTNNTGEQPNNTSIVINDDKYYSVGYGNVSNKIKNDYYYLDISKSKIEKTIRYYFEYRLILEKNEYVKNFQLNNVDVYILDYIQMSGRPERKEFLGSTYNEDGSIKEENYIPNKEIENKLFLINPINKNIYIKFGLFLPTRLKFINIIGKRFNIKTIIKDGTFACKEIKKLTGFIKLFKSIYKKQMTYKMLVQSYATNYDKFERNFYADINASNLISNNRLRESIVDIGNELTINLDEQLMNIKTNFDINEFLTLRMLKNKMFGNKYYTVYEEDAYERKNGERWTTELETTLTPTFEKEDISLYGLMFKYKEEVDKEVVERKNIKNKQDIEEMIPSSQALVQNIKTKVKSEDNKNILTFSFE